MAGHCKSISRTTAQHSHERQHEILRIAQYVMGKLPLAEKREAELKAKSVFVRNVGLSEGTKHICSLKTRISSLAQEVTTLEKGSKEADEGASVEIWNGVHVVCSILLSLLRDSDDNTNKTHRGDCDCVCSQAAVGEK